MRPRSKCRARKEDNEYHHLPAASVATTARLQARTEPRSDGCPRSELEPPKLLMAVGGALQTRRRETSTRQCIAGRRAHAFPICTAISGGAFPTRGDLRRVTGGGEASDLLVDRPLEPQTPATIRSQMPKETPRPSNDGQSRGRCLSQQEPKLNYDKGPIMTRTVKG